MHAALTQGYFLRVPQLKGHVVVNFDGETSAAIVDGDGPLVGQETPPDATGPFEVVFVLGGGRARPKLAQIRHLPVNLEK